MSRNLNTLIDYLENQYVYIPIFLENAGMKDLNELDAHIKDMSKDELEQWVNTIV